MARSKVRSEYKIFYSMKRRCDNPKDNSYPYYGGRGIKVSEEWPSFREFIRDMGPRPEGFELDRIDNEKGYGPQNCRWTDKKTNGRNRRSNRILDYNGESGTLSYWSERTAIGRVTISGRLDMGWSIAEALGFEIRCSDRLKRRRYLEYNGLSKSLEEWALEIGIVKSALLKRINSGWSIEKALTTPRNEEKRK